MTPATAQEAARCDRRMATNTGHWGGSFPKMLPIGNVECCPLGNVKNVNQWLTQWTVGRF
ncbi:MAG: hypothetical protein HOP29_17250 [Phycisphaerales bacterium]|nr:hypothetical protein [Phycisphaerales bacterium]